MIIYAGGKPIKRLGKHQAKLLEFALLFQGWHSISKKDKPIAESLAKRKLLEVNGDQFRFKDTRE